MYAAQASVGAVRKTLVTVMTLVMVLTGILTADPASAQHTNQRIRWDVPGSKLVLPNGWTLRTTSTPFIKVIDEYGHRLGNIELGNYTLEAELARARSQAELNAILRARANRFHRNVGADRESLGHDYEAYPSVRVRWGQEQGIRYRAVVRDYRGKTVERILGYQAVRNGQLWILTVNGVGNGDPSDGEDLLSVAQQRILARYMKDVLRTSPMPSAGTAIEDGMIAGTEGGLNGGRLWFIWQGKKQRIYQPGGMTVHEADRYVDGDRIAQLVVSGRRTKSAFKVVPPNGADARLHVLIGNKLHEVVVQHVRSDVIDALPSLQPQVLDRLVVPGS